MSAKLQTCLIAMKVPYLTQVQCKRFPALRALLISGPRLRDLSLDRHYHLLDLAWRELPMSAWEGPLCNDACHLSYCLTEPSPIPTNVSYLYNRRPCSARLVEPLNRAGCAPLAVDMPRPAMHSVSRGSSYLAAHSDLPGHLIERAR